MGGTAGCGGGAAVAERACTACMYKCVHLEKDALREFLPELQMSKPRAEQPDTRKVGVSWWCMALATCSVLLRVHHTRVGLLCSWLQAVWTAVRMRVICREWCRGRGGREVRGR